MCNFKIRLYCQSRITQIFSSVSAQILDISNVDLSLKDVENALSGLDSKTSFDSDAVANIILKKCNLHLNPFFIIFNKLLSSGVFMGRWTISKLAPNFIKFYYSQIQQVDIN